MAHFSIITPIAACDSDRLYDAIARVNLIFDLRTTSEKTNREWKWVVVCDGWTPDDDQRTLLGRVGGVRLLCIRSPKGPGAARNLALATMPADEIVWFLDADDRPMPDEIVQVVRDFAKTSQQGTIPCLEYAGIGVSRPDAPLIVHHSPEIVWTRDMLKNQNMLIPLQVISTAGTLLNAGGFEPNLICSEDWLLWRRVFENEKNTIWQSREIVGIYTWRQDSQSKALRKFSDLAFHLDQAPDKHGPAGVNLDTLAKARAALSLDVNSICGSEIQYTEIFV